MGFSVQVLRSRVRDLRFRVQDLWFRVQDLRFRVQGQGSAEHDRRDGHFSTPNHLGGNPVANGFIFFNSHTNAR